MASMIRQLQIPNEDQKVAEKIHQEHAVLLTWLDAEPPLPSDGEIGKLEALESVTRAASNMGGGHM